MPATAVLDASQLFEHQRAVLPTAITELASEQFGEAPNAERELERSVFVLEFLLVGAAVVEAGSDLSGERLPANERARAIRASAKATIGEDPLEILSRHNRVLMQLTAATAGASAKPLPPDALELLSRFVQIVVSLCPIQRLEESASISGRADLGHRCRLAYDRLRSFLRRHEVRNNARLKAAGIAYADGRLTLEEVAAILGVSRADCIFELEKFGFARSIEKISLTADARAEILGRIATERAMRGGRPSPSGTLLAREVIATQRIEDVDARPWLEPEKA